MNVKTPGRANSFAQMLFLRSRFVWKPPEQVKKQTNINTVIRAGMPNKLQKSALFSRKKPPILQFLTKCFVNPGRLSTFVRRLTNEPTALNKPGASPASNTQPLQSPYSESNLILLLFAKQIQQTNTLDRRIDLMFQVNT